jgi:integrase
MATNPYQANRALALISNLYNYLELPNPAKGIRRYHERTRETHVEPKQLVKLFEALAEHKCKPFVAAIVLLWITGVRKRDILEAKWSDVDFNKKQLLIESGKIYIVLNGLALMILNEVYDPRNVYIIPGTTFDKPRVNINKAWTRLTRSLGVRARIHDLRHTFASLVANTDANIFTLKDLLRHASRAALSL